MADYSDHSYPPFPSNVPTAILERISLQRLLEGDQEESQRLFEACKVSGFFSLDMRGAENGDKLLKLVPNVFELSKSLFSLPEETKLAYTLRGGSAYGYKGVGFSKVDSKGTPDRCEFWGVSKDGLVGNGEAERWPSILDAGRPTLHDFAQQAHSLCVFILSHLNKHLGLDQGKLASLHRIDRVSTDQVRLLKMPPQPEGDRRTSLLPHTDFGSVTLVWNILGGLQIQESGASNIDEGWKFVRPEPGCAVVNLGDAMVKLSNSVLKSSLHRVAYAPGAQATLDRYSLAYFSRPENDVKMEGLCAVTTDRAQPEEDSSKFNMQEWAAQKTRLYTQGGGQKKSSGGTAHLAVRQE